MFPFELKSKRKVEVDRSRDILLKDLNFVGTDFSAIARNVSFTSIGCVFESCDFGRMRSRSVSFGGGTKPSRYVQCKFDGSKLINLSVGLARFEQCSFLNVDIEGLFTHAAEFVDCTFSGKLRRSVFFGRVCGVYEKDVDGLKRAINEFRGNDFSSMQFIDVDFRAGVDLTLQRLPSGDNYLYLENAEEKLSNLREKYVLQPASERRREVFDFLQSVEEEVRNGQRDLFLCKDSLPPMSRGTIDAIWEDLRVFE